MKKHFGKFGIALVAALLMLLTCALCASAAGTATVVYLSGSGTNTADGLTPETAVASINKAYSLLDPNKDCTVVVCGPFTQNGHFARSHSANSITITSVYNNVDYRKAENGGAVYKLEKGGKNKDISPRFGLADDTTFENITFEAADCSFLLVAQHHVLTIGEGVKMNGFNGADGGKAFWIVGSVQWNFGGAEGAEGPKYLNRPTPTNVTVLSGSDMIVVGGPRDFSTKNKVTQANACTYGDINVHIGGEAKVSALHAGGSSSAYTTVGDIHVEVFGNASVDKLYGAYVHNVTASNLSLLWIGGSVGLFKMTPNGKNETVGLSIADGGAVTLEATEAVQNDTKSGYATIAAVTAFTEKVTHTHDFDTENGKELTPATCQAEGKVLYTCKTCSATEEGTLAKTDHAFGKWTTTTPAGFGTKGEEKRTCAYCDAFETREIPAITAKLEPGSVSAATDKTGTGTIRLIATLKTTAGANVTRYGIFVARTDAIDGAKFAEWTATTGTETAFALDLSDIPHSELDTPIYAWAFATVDGEQIVRQILVGASVDGILTEMGA